MGRRARPKTLDAGLDDLAPELRWREWMGRVEAVIFASKDPVAREVLARVVGPDCNLDLVIEDIRAELRGRPYDLVAVAGRTAASFISRLKTRAFFGISSPPENCLYYPCLTFGVRSRAIPSQVNVCCNAQSTRVSQLMTVRHE
jgi:hypothetical protein